MSTPIQETYTVNPSKSVTNEALDLYEYHNLA